MATADTATGSTEVGWAACVAVCSTDTLMASPASATPGMAGSGDSAIGGFGLGLGFGGFGSRGSAVLASAIRSWGPGLRRLGLGSRLRLGLSVLGMGWLGMGRLGLGRLGLGRFWTVVQSLSVPPRRVPQWRGVPRKRELCQRRDRSGSNGVTGIRGAIGQNQGTGFNRGLSRGGLAANRGVQSPPSSHPFGNPFRSGNVTRAVNRSGQGQVQRASSMASGSRAFRPSFNGVNSAASLHNAARPAFTGNSAGLGARQGLAGGANPGMARGNLGAVNGGAGLNGGGVPLYRGQGMSPGMGGQGLANQARAGGLGAQGMGPQGQGFAQGLRGGGMQAAPAMPNSGGMQMGGMRYGGAPMGGYGGGFRGAPMGGGFGGGGFRGGGFSGGGFGGGGHGGGGGGGHR